MISLRRSFDLVGATAGLIFATPVIVGLGTMMGIVNRGNPFFLQNRIGQNGAEFKILKIRTMRDAFNEAGEPLPDVVRTSKLGVWVRKSKLDELPQLWNVIRGEMSLVGPRPLIRQDPIAQDQIRMQVKPGITGLAQIIGLNRISFEEQLRIDNEYVQRSQSSGTLSKLAYDLSIIVRTPFGIIRNMAGPHSGQMTHRNNLDAAA